MESANFLNGMNPVPIDSLESTLSGDVSMPADIIALEESAESTEEAGEENLEYSGVVSFITSRFNRAKEARQDSENRWLECYRNFRGEYGPDVQFTETEKSRAFIKITKTKVLASYGKLSTILFANSKFPIGIEATPVPEGVAEAVYFDPKEPKDDQTKELNKKPDSISRSEIFDSLEKRSGIAQKALERLPETVKVKEGVGKTPTSQTYYPAEMSAKKMEKTILDQLDEADASKHLRSFIHEMCLFGSGIMKGPFAQNKEYPRWDEKGKYSPLFKVIPDVVQTSIWNNYPDPDARNKSDCDYWIERHRMNRSQVRALKKRPYFKAESINLVLERGPNYIEEYWESILEDNHIRGSENSERWEVLEYWGNIDKELAEEAEFEIPKELEDQEEFQVNIWICGGQILRFIINPFNPARIPYHVCPYETNPYSIFGIGVAENMADTQLIMNGFFRLSIDNAVLSSNVVFEVDETNLVPGQDLSVYPGKVFRRQGGAPGQALFGTKFPNVTQECMLMFDKARQLADEATGIPSYAHGMSGIMSTGRTASGMSMLMGAADENIKTVVRNVDDYLLIPLGQSLYSFNMQFNFDPDIKGDLTVVARGTESLMRNEIRSQKLLQFLQITSNDLDAPFVKRDYILRELAQSLDLDPDKIVNDTREAAIQAEMLKSLKQAMGNEGQPTDFGGGANSAGASMPSDPTGNGGGNITPGASPMPGAEGFSGATPPNLGLKNE